MDSRLRTGVPAVVTGGTQLVARAYTGEVFLAFLALQAAHAQRQSYGLVQMRPPPQPERVPTDVYVDGADTLEPTKQLPRTGAAVKFMLPEKRLTLSQPSREINATRRLIGFRIVNNGTDASFFFSLFFFFSSFCVCV